MVAHSATHKYKRHGKHQRHTRPFLKVYWPYIPMAVILSVGLAFSVLWQVHTKGQVLAYATSMSTSGLLSSTNQQRSNNGKKSLKLNSKLNQAAQAKAADMVAKDYWSHNTPSGNPPWVFIDQTGYDYSSAGENLAYGFITSGDTVSGWMNSAGHKANLLSSSFVEVGFGFANSADFNDDGEQTVVVAMYAAPQVLTSSTADPAPASAASQPSAAAAEPVPKTKPAEPKKDPAPVAVTTDSSPRSQAVAEVSPVKVSRFAALTGGALPWIASAVSLTIAAAAAALLGRHSYALHRWVRRGERYVLHHVVFDVTIVSLLGLCIVVSQAAGYVL